MGRRQFWTRLALGRSAFERLENYQNEPQGTDAVLYQQRYDVQGRPENPETDVRNAEMRRAQNTILKLVGIVEARDQQLAGDDGSGLTPEQRARNRAKLLEREDDVGDTLDMALAVVQYLSNRIPATLLVRYLIGLYDPRAPFVDTLRLHFGSANGWKGILAGLISGTAARLAHTLIRTALVIFAEAGVGDLQELVIARKEMGRRDARFWYSALESIRIASMVLIDVIALPLNFLAVTQSLGLHPALPLFPSWRAFVPWGARSLHAFAWKPVAKIPLLGDLTSPAALLIAWSLIHDESSLSAGVPICSIFTSFRFPAVNAPFNRSSRFSISHDPMGWVLHGFYLARKRFMTFCHWSLEASQNHDSARTFVDNVSTRALEQPGRGVQLHRSTTLAHLPAVTLAKRVDSLFQRLLLMPLQCAVYRAVAFAFLHTDVPKTALALPAGPSLSPVFGGGPVGRMLSAGAVSMVSLSEIGQYMNKIGLCIALQVGLDACMLGAAYYLARIRGVKEFGWKTAKTRSRTDAQEVE